MILNSIVLDNIRSYEHEEIEFQRGISLFEGDIGSGKSTVLMSIEFALFGLGSQKPEALLAKKAERGYVILECTVDGKRYKIRRTLKRKPSGVNQDPKESWIKEEEQKVPLSPSELKQRVLQILKFNEPADPKAESKIFRYVIFTPQEAMKEVLSDSKKRLETIRKAFGIEDYSIAESNAKDLLSEIRIKTAALEGKFSNITELELEIRNAEAAIAQIKQDMASEMEKKAQEEAQQNQLTNEIKRLQEKSSEQSQIMSNKKNVEKNIESLSRQISQIETEIGEFESEIAENNDRLEKLLEIEKPETKLTISQIIDETKRIQKISDESIKLDSEKDTVQSDISRIKKILGDSIGADATTLKNALHELEREKDSLSEFQDELKEKQDDIKSQQVEKSTLKRSIEKEIEEFSNLGTACPTCKQEITEGHHHSLVYEKQKEVDALKKDIKDTTDSFFDSDAKLKEIKQKQTSYDEEISKIQRILPALEELSLKSARLGEIKTKISQNQAQNTSGYGDNPIEYLSNLKDQIMQFDSAEDQIRKMVETRDKIEQKIVVKKELGMNLEKEFEANQAELNRITSELENFENIGEKIVNAESELDKCREKISELTGTIAASNQKITNEHEKIDSNQSKIEESNKWKTRHGVITQFKNWLEKFFIPTISQIEKQVLLSILQDFNETYARLYAILVEDPTKESRIDENFTPVVNQDGYEQEIGFLSGGEKTSVALAYRLTLNSLMRKETDSMKSNLLILDEPTDGFSKNQLSKIRDLLDELKSEQIILVSHEKELETYVDNIYQISKEMGISRINRM